MVKLAQIKSVIKRSKYYIDNDRYTITLNGCMLSVVDKELKVYVDQGLRNFKGRYGSYRNLVKIINRRLIINDLYSINRLKIV